MQTRHKDMVTIDHLLVVHLPLKQVCFNLFGEALTEPRNLLPLWVSNIYERLVKEKSKGIAKILMHM